MTAEAAIDPTSASPQSPPPPRGWSRWLIAATGALVIAVSLVGVVMLRSAEASAEEPSGSSIDAFLTQEAGVANSEPARIKYRGPDGFVSLRNTETVILSNDLRVAVAVSPYPPTAFDVDVDLFITTSDGVPVADASVTAEWDMVFMWHGPFFTEFVPAGDGHYRAPFDMFMFGPWELITRVSAPGHPQPDDLSLSIYVWPE